ncbi:MAG: 2-oxoglutarate oxidoreductase [Deltaproteobacteria bacterium]|jgi:2-oxoglutarate ferredoxin oxidoreductase subunit beta|nr:2-oxoglutarate oxidoreductase [Deltaproteobacteria bacterium]
MKYKSPEAIAKRPTLFCQGCAQGIINRLIGEIMEELDKVDKLIVTTDVACGAMNVIVWDYDTIVGAHGRPLPTALGVKKVRPDCVSLAHLGDGAAYNIGLAETMHSAIRNDNVVALVANNCVFAMTGGQMSATTLPGQRTPSTVNGRDCKATGNPFRIENAIGKLDIAYLARGSVDSVKEINKTKKMLKKAFEKHLAGEGFCLVEILTPCPTNWGLSPLDSMKYIREEVVPVYPLGEFVDREESTNA